ncbi:MAG: hypothetical protein A3J97_06125 [Spirochaetes bacterium RIFOXYC1_FULL_54_7]|nr:MAG: hypothetical protein A3J97_06125 [Spirochaetes bacterium RIFOXYC1_FULL_54_7]
MSGPPVPPAFVIPFDEAVVHQIASEHGVVLMNRPEQVAYLGIRIIAAPLEEFRKAAQDDQFLFSPGWNA